MRVRPLCAHCHNPVPEGAPSARYCCAGCEAVAGLLRTQGLERYYALAGDAVTPAAPPAEARSLVWLAEQVERAEAGPGQVCSLELDVQGIHCAACVWLMNETFRRRAGAAGVTVNPALGKVHVRWERGAVDLAAWVRDVEAFGYRFGPGRKSTRRELSDLTVRLGVSAAITGNVMLFSFAFYAGLSPADGEVFRAFTALSVLLSGVAVVVGGWPFFRASWLALRSGLVHLDLPIALGILGVFALSVVQLRRGRGDLLYLDTLNTFITLMLFGRWLQERVLERNRRFLLEDDGADGVRVRREANGALETVPAPSVRAGDVVLVAPGDLVPVDLELLDPTAQTRSDWMTGEPDVRGLLRGATVAAGSSNAGQSAFRGKALTDFADSALSSLLRSPMPASHAHTQQRFWARLAKGWAAGVLVLAAAGFALWWPRGTDAALAVAVSLLVVTCPCALGISIPLAYELVQSRLRRAGFYARSADLLDRLVDVRAVVFDKTGTLTLGRLALEHPEHLRWLEPSARDAAYNLAARSSHPVSVCLAEALKAHGAQYAEDARVTEVPGQGLELQRPEGTWRLGRGDWAARGSEPRLTVLSLNGLERATFPTQEVLRPDAREQLSLLQRDGFSAHVLSGDHPLRVAKVANALGIPLEHTRGGLSPEGKAYALQRLSAGRALYLGDGVNDALAFNAALCAGTPAVDRPVLPARSDFFILGDGLGVLREALTLAHRLRRAVQLILVLSLSYNTAVVALALLGRLTPLRAAVAMPVSSVAFVLLAVWLLRAPRAPQPVAVLALEVPA